MIHGTTSIYTQVFLCPTPNPLSIHDLTKECHQLHLRRKATKEHQTNAKRMAKNSFIPRNVFLPVIRNCTQGSAMSLSFPSNANGWESGGGTTLFNYTRTPCLGITTLRVPNHLYNIHCMLSPQEILVYRVILCNLGLGKC